MMTRLAALGQWINKTHLIFVYVITLVIAAVKTGFNFTPIGTGEIRADLWPAPTGSLGGSSYGMRGLAISLGLESFRDISFLGIALTTAALLIFLATLNSGLSGTSLRIVLVLITSSPFVIILFSYIGRFDTFLLTGSWLIAVAPLLRWTRLTYTIGIALMLLGNPEQSVIAGILLFILSLNSLFVHYRYVSLTLVLTAGIVVVLTSRWASSIGEPSRLTYWPQYLSLSWSNFSSNLPLVFYSAYGTLWLVILLFILVSSMRRQLLALAVFLVIPGAVVATTIDQTRVFVGITFLAAAVLTLGLIPRVVQATGSSRRAENLLVATLFLGCLLMPAIEVDQFGGVRSSYAWLAYLMNTGLSFI